jgi:tRNA-specific 2-thiouridylase
MREQKGELVVIAMSGGVDSSMAAALLIEQGYQVVGIMLRLWAEADYSSGANRCCTPEAVDDAQAVAQALGIPFYLRDYRATFKAHVVDYFVASYVQGLTPNPCLACNQHIRFGRLLAEAQAMGASYLATGHYARIQRAGGRYQLLRGIDPARDQSYVLYMLTQEALAHVLFPLGDYTKKEVRDMARARGLPVAEKGESQDLCFVAKGDYREFLERVAPETIRPGPILDSAGHLLGRHRGLAHYTIGQRHGLGIAAPEPLYVLEMDTAHNTLLIGPAGELGQEELLATEVSYISGLPPESPVSITARIRYKAQEAPATLDLLNGQQALVSFARPQRDITPGQGVVFYQGEAVLGGGIISRQSPGDARL